MLFKKLIGNTIYHTTSSCPDLRIYAYSSNTDNSTVQNVGDSPNTAEGIVLTLINLSNSSKRINIQIANQSTSCFNNFTLWVLEPGEPIPDADSPLQSFQTQLNGEVLSLSPTFPDMRGQTHNGTVNSSLVLTVPATSLAFVRTTLC